MALVSPSVPIHLRHPQLDRRPSMQSFRRNMSVRSSGSRSEVEIEEQEVVVEKVYVAVGKEYKESKETLIWVLQNISREKKIVLVHVHRAAQMIPMMGAKFHVHQLQPEHVRGYRQVEKQKMNKTLDEYLALCSHAKIQAETLVKETDDIGKGLVELIAENGIMKLVMGAAADRLYSKKMKAPKSKTAINVQQQADPACNIWFVCKGNLICTRDSVLGISGFPASATAKLNSGSPQLNQLRCRSLPQHPTETPEQFMTPPQRSRSDKYYSRGVEVKPLIPLEMSVNTTPISSSSVEEIATDPWEGISSSQASDHSISSLSDDVISNMSSLPISTDERLHMENESQENLQFSTPTLETEDNEIDGEIYEKLQDALKEAAESKREAYEESCRRRQAERRAIEVAQKVKLSENLYSKELKQRKEAEATLAREKIELDKLKTQCDEAIQELQKANEKKMEIELQAAESERMIKDFQEKLSAAKCLLSSLQNEHNSLQKERGDATKEVEKLLEKREDAATSIQKVMNFSEFTYAELQRATNNFDDSTKIGEGGYGCVYKGFLRHTTVAIKMLNSQSTQGKEEFYQEVEILSRVRHPHLITLIGTCPEAWALIYEYLPQGSLEDRLVCQDNTAPLPWQIRTQIAAEICCALIFLHSNKPHTVVHGDLKPANILLDSNFTSKLGDFGISRLLVQSTTTTTLYRRTHPKGTFVYMDPEFLCTGELTPRSDVYSYGVILLRMLTGRPALGIIKDVKGAMEGGRLHEILDVSAGDWPFLQAKQLANLALKCCEIKRKNRPDLAKEAWRVLEPMTKATLSVGSLSGNSCIPSYFICPIFQEIMRDPHIAADGFTYEAEALKGWLDAGQETSPMTNLKLAHRDLIPNRALRSAIQEWLQKQK